jgi:hypothetical protein
VEITKPTSARRAPQRELAGIYLTTTVTGFSAGIIMLKKVGALAGSVAGSVAKSLLGQRAEKSLSDTNKKEPSKQDKKQQLKNFLEQRQYDQAALLWVNLGATAPLTYEQRIAFIEPLYAQGQTDLAQPFIEAYLEKHPHDIAMLMKRAHWFADHYRLEEALLWLDIALPLLTNAQERTKAQEWHEQLRMRLEAGKVELQ